jgi:ubiquinone/menaquinone biosynthesis C-methylase UbiE
MSKIGVSEVAAAWDVDAPNWAAEVRAGHDRIHELFTSPRFMEFLPDLAGLSLVELGCGEGRYTRAFARRGAHPTGIDISPGMLELARQEEARAPLGIRYQLDSSTELRSLADHSFDMAVSSMALMDTPNFAAVAREAHRVIRPGGRFFFSVLHPCFMTRESGWATDGEGRVVGRKISNYWNTEPYTEQWGFENAPPFTIFYFPWRLEDYVNGLCEAGFRIERMEEPRPSNEVIAALPADSFLAKIHHHTAFVLFVAARKI